VLKLIRRKTAGIYNRQIGKMRKDLIVSLRRKGIQISNVQINIEQNSVLLRLSMPQE